tara:strand:- start:407 stop:673 length:267 start_codon:yes stop_codon:yes gene_type:complete
MHSGAPVAQKPNRLPAPFARESLTYPVFAAGRYGLLGDIAVGQRLLQVGDARVRDPGAQLTNGGNKLAIAWAELPESVKTAVLEMVQG